MRHKTKIKKRNGELGAAVVEFVLVLPLLLVILFGIIEFSIILYDNAIITNASREATRYWIVFRDNTTKQTLETFSEIEKKVKDYSVEHLISFGPNSQDTYITTTTKINGVTETAQPWNYTHGDVLAVTVDYQYDWLLLPAFIQALTPPLVLSAETVMRAE